MSFSRRGNGFDELPIRRALLTNSSVVYTQ